MTTNLRIENLEYKKYIKRAVSNPGILAQTGNISQEAKYKLMSSEWVDVGKLLTGEIPSRSFDDPKALPEFDAYQQVGDWDADSSTQRAYSGSALYRITLPSAAAANALTAISFAVTTSRYTEEGGNIEVWRSATSTPSADWNITGSGIATALEESEIGKPTTYPATTHVSQTLTFSPVSDFATGDYLWILVNLEEYGGNRGYWVEGAIATALSTLSIDVDATFTPVEITTNHDLYMMLTRSITSSGGWGTSNLRYTKYHLEGYSASDVFGKITAKLQLLKASKLNWIKTSGGARPDQIGHNLSRDDSDYSGSTLYIQKIEVTKTQLKGKNIYLKSVGGKKGSSGIRIIVVDGHIWGDPPSTNVSLDSSYFYGTHADVIATKVFDTLTDGETLEIPITKNPATDVLTFMCVIEKVDYTDRNLASIGTSPLDTPPTYIDLTDGYIAEKQFSA